MKYYSSKQFIDKLVSFATVSSEPNLPLIQFVQSYLSGHGVACKILPGPDGKKANLYATIGPMVEGGVILSGHTDVVPVQGQPWDSDPFQVLEQNNRLYGRGTADMKSFLAVALAFVPQMLKKGLRKPIHLALSYDEEIGCFGAPAMIREMAEKLPRPMTVIVGEPTSMRFINAHKGIGSYTTTITGHEAHSSQIDYGVSAVMTAARLVTFLEDLMIENRQNVSPGVPFDPPYTTVHVGVIKGGTAVNIIARECSFDWDVRTVSGEDARDYVNKLTDFCKPLLQEMQKVSPDCSIITTMNAEAPGLSPETDGAAEQLCRHLTGKKQMETVSYATEAGLFQKAGLSTVICGPGSINQAHRPNEYIEISQIQKFELFMHNLMEYLS